MTRQITQRHSQSHFKLWFWHTRTAFGVIVIRGRVNKTVKNVLYASEDL